jgi:hypothetical protein
MEYLDWIDYIDYKPCVMEDLIGKTIKGLAISSDQHVLEITHDEGTFLFATKGDAVTETWIADIIGVANLIGELVVDAQNVEVPTVDDGRTRVGMDVFYGIKLETTRGYVDIVYRASSENGYGGNLVKVTGTDKRFTRRGMAAIKDDYSA